MNRILVAALLTSVVAACGDDDKDLQITLFAAAPDAIEMGQSSRLLFVVQPSNAQAEISGVGDVTGQTEVMVTPNVTTDFELTAKKGSRTVTQTVTITVGPHLAAGLKVEAQNTTPNAGDAFDVKLTAITGDGSTAPGYRGTVHLTSSDGQAVLPADVTFDASDAGVKTVPVTLKTAGVETVTGADVAHPGTTGTSTVTVGPGAATGYSLSALPAAAVAGQALVLSITAHDAFGNVATTYAGTVALTSTDPTDVLPAAGGFTAGVRTVNVEFTTAGDHHATVADVATLLPSVDTTIVTIGASLPVAIDIAPANPSTTAGVDEGFTASLVDLFGNPCTNFTGTVHFASNDAQAVLPADYTFTVLDAGAHAFDVTFKTAGTDAVNANDTGGTATGSGSWAVGPAAASTCVASQAPAAATAGSVVGMTVTVRDAFGNLATTYGGTVHVTSTDPRATLPGDVTYNATDAGSHAFSASLITAGTQAVTATDTVNAAITCSASIVVAPGAPTFVLTLPTDANAGYAAALGLAVRDVFANPITNYAGTVTFTNTDTATGATTPAPIVFTGAEGGVASTSATFMTIGSQTVAASDTAGANGAASVKVHGLVYTAPATGRVRFVINAAGSNTNTVQLDMIANVKLEVSNLFGSFGAPGSFATGMNLPLDTTRVGAGAPLFTAGNAFSATGNPFGAGTIGSDHVLYTVESRKRVTGTNATQEDEVAQGKVFYSVRLQLAQNGTVGPVFDGASPSPLYRASVRDQYGDDFVNQGDFGIGKLEVR